jgi:hypothetical protein
MLSAMKDGITRAGDEGGRFMKGRYVKIPVLTAIVSSWLIALPGFCQDKPVEPPLLKATISVASKAKIKPPKTEIPKLDKTLGPWYASWGDLQIYDVHLEPYSDGQIGRIVGIIRNAGDEPYSLISIYGRVVDAQGVTVDKRFTAVPGLDAGENFRFKIPMTPPFDRYQINEIKAFKKR